MMVIDIFNVLFFTQEKEELKVKEKEEKRQKRISKKLGKTGNGEE